MQAHSHTANRLGGRANSSQSYGTGNLYFEDGSTYNTGIAGVGTTNMNPYNTASFVIKA